MMTEVLQPPKLSNGRLFLLGASSVILCLSYLMAVFTPFPLAMAVVLYGRVRGYTVALLGLVTCAVLAALVFTDPAILGFYLFMSLIAAIIAEATLREWAPVKTIVLAGGILLLVLGGGVWWFLQSENISLTEKMSTEISAAFKQMSEMGQGQVEDLESLGVDSPEVLAKGIVEALPGYAVMGIYFIFWVNAYLVFKGHRLLHPERVFKHDERSLMNFRVPFAWVYTVILAFVLILWGDKTGWSFATPVGMNLLRMIGVFYFFQGFGIMLEFLNRWNIAGFFRTLLVMGTVFFVPWLVAVLGLFDGWFDFAGRTKTTTTNNHKV